MRLQTRRSKIFALAVSVVVGAAIAVPLALSVSSGSPEAPESITVPGPPPGGGALDTGATPSSAALQFQPGAADTLAATPELADAPWIFQPNGARFYRDEPQRPSLTFPAGTTYSQAIQALYESVTLKGSVPEGTTLGSPLPEGKIVLKDARGAGTLTVDLRAPFGYEPESKAITLPVYSLPGSWSLEKVDRVWRDARERRLSFPEGGRVATPIIPACQIATAGEEHLSPSC